MRTRRQNVTIGAAVAYNPQNPGSGEAARGAGVDDLLGQRGEDYVLAAELSGASASRVITKHLLPSFTSYIIVYLVISFPYMILSETALSFIGLGLRPPVVSWGVLLQDCMNMQVVSNYPWLLLPVIFIVMTVLCFNFLGDGLRDAADPYH